MNVKNALSKPLNLGIDLLIPAYENETAVGNAIKKCGIPREELFITSKLWVTDTSYEKAKDGFYRSLKKLGLDYIDLYLIHQPYNDVFDNPILQEITLKHHKSVAQIVIRWLLQRGIVPVIKSSNQDRIKENINVYDFELNIEEMLKISKLDTKTSTSQRTKGDEVENFLKNTTNFNV